MASQAAQRFYGACRRLLRRTPESPDSPGPERIKAECETALKPKPSYPTSSPATLGGLPHELFYHITDYLPTASLSALQQTSRPFRDRITLACSTCAAPGASNT